MPETPSAGDSAPHDADADRAALPIDATVIASNTSVGPAGPLSMAELGRSLEGRSLGPYRLIEFVGGGGMGAVFRALDSTLDRIVAVKVLSRQQSADEEMLKRFRNEAQSAARLDHENIGRVHAVGSDDGWHYIVFEYIEGTNLRDVVNAQGPFDLARAIDVTVQLAAALEHASDRDVVHRDIKPSNIIITPAGKARIVDMGLARLHQVAGDQDLTASGMTLGTFDYISPEQARDPRAADVRSDLYSLGCTIYFVLAGRPPFADGTMVQKLLQHQQDEPPQIESLRPDVPRRFGDILRRLMKKDPAERYQRPAELIADVAAFVDEAGIAMAGPRPLVTVVAEPPPGRFVDHLPWLVPVVALGAVVAGLWLRSLATRSDPAVDAGTVAVTDGTGLATDQAAVRVWRVTGQPGNDDERATIAEAVRTAGDGDVVELAYTGVRDEPPFKVARKQLTLRAAKGFTPMARFSLSSPPEPLDATAGGWRPAGCVIESGSLRIEGVTIEAIRDAAAGGGPLVVFQVLGAAALECIDTRLLLDDGDGARAVVDAGPETADASFIEAQPLDAARGREQRDIRFVRSSAKGRGVVCRAIGGGELTVGWSESEVVDAERFLVAEGVDRGAGAGATVRLSLDGCSFACREGFASLRDSPSRPIIATMQAFAERCRFRIPDGRPLIEQAGVGDPEVYRAAVEWLDSGGRYEGSEVFRRIDGAAERVEMDYASSPQPLVHLPAGADGEDGEE